ncbi:MAG: head GIN domain-containing protein [Omnitrophica WOR_2 bacterium]
MNKKLWIPINLAALLFLSGVACSISFNTPFTTRGSGNVISQERQVTNFHRVSLSGIGDLTITQGDTESLKIQAEDNLMPLIESDVRGDTLYLGFKNQPRQNIQPTKSIQYTLMLISLDDLEVSGIGNAQVSALKSGNMDIKTSGVGKITFDSLSADQLHLEVSGVGGVTISGGTVPTQDIHISGTGNYQAGNLKSQKVTADISGAGSATVWASDSLSVHISGAGSVSYYGKPSISQDLSGAGRLTALGDK